MLLNSVCSTLSYFSALPLQFAEDILRDLHISERHKLASLATALSCSPPSKPPLAQDFLTDLDLLFLNATLEKPITAARYKKACRDLSFLFTCLLFNLNSLPNDSFSLLIHTITCCMFALLMARDDWQNLNK